jgi:hypothetical protein
LTVDEPGIYYITVSNGFCENFSAVTVRLLGSMSAPSATTPQTFCDGATVLNLQTINGVNVVWYDLETDGTILPKTHLLKNDSIYYAAQNIGGCEGGRTAVKVIINNNVSLPAPNLPGLVDLCGPATLANIPTNGNTNIVWYDGANNKLLLSTPLVNEISYFAAQSGGGSCESIGRTKVTVNLTDVAPNAPVMEDPQHFCEGALVGNLATPNNQIVWYDAATDGNQLSPFAALEDNEIYYAAQKAGTCESAVRTPVTVILDELPPPVAPPLQATCNGILMLSDIWITGSEIKWYNDELAGTEYASPTTTPVVNGETYYAAQSSDICESERIGITITTDCYKPYGTIFPFVYIEDEDDFNDLFITTAKLYTMPPATTLDKIGYIRKQTPIKSAHVIHYNCDNDTIVGAPKNLGVIGATNNPGKSIRWDALGISNPGIQDPDTLNTIYNCPDQPMGKFIFEDVAKGKYILEISRQGFLTRYGVINVEGDDYLGHRELLAGDVNGDLVIDPKDISLIRTKTDAYGTATYKWIYDLDGDGIIDDKELDIIRINIGAYITIYQETEDWLNQ